MVDPIRLVMENVTDEQIRKLQRAADAAQKRADVGEQMLSALQQFVPGTSFRDKAKALFQSPWMSFVTAFRATPKEPESREKQDPTNRSPRRKG